MEKQHYTSEYCPKCKLKGDPEEVYVGMLQHRDGMFKCSNPECDFEAPLVANTLFQTT
jgi:hypothetical protein